MRDPSGRGAALYARAADNSPTVYLGTAGHGPPGQPVHGPDPDVTDRTAPIGPTAHLDPDEESDADGDADDIGATAANSILADTKAMLALMVHTWEPILARCRHSGSRADEAPPTWEDFKRECERELPTPTPAQPFTLTDEILIDFIRKRPSRRAGGLDGWTTREAKDLPDPILCLFAQVLRAMQRTGHVPEPLLHIPNPCLRKGKGELPTDQRLLSVMSVWMYAWEAPAYRSLAEWRKGWTHPTSFGAVPKATIHDVSTALALRVEHARSLALPLAGVALDRQKCFDYLVTDVCLALALHAGCPADIVNVRRTFYAKHQRYIRMGGAY